MFAVQKRPSGSSCLEDMSRAEILRGLVSDKLSTALQEILAVVERTVAGFEDEAAGYRTQISRQKKQLEALLQPRVRLERTALNPDVEGHEVVVGELKEEEEQQKQHSDVEDSGSFTWYNEDVKYYDDVGGECDDHHQPSTPQTAFRIIKKNLKYPDVEIATTSRQKGEEEKDPDFRLTLTPRSEFGKKKKRGRPRSSDEPKPLELKVRFLEDPQVNILSKTVFQTCPAQDLQCPRGLKTEEFLELLRSVFPQLQGQEPFDVSIADRSKRLHSLNMKTITAEEIYSSGGKSALYIRLKKVKEEEELRPEASNDSLSLEVKTEPDEPSMSYTIQHPEGNPSSSMSQHTEEAGESHMDSSDCDGKDGDEMLDGGDDWELDSEQEIPQKKKKKKKGSVKSSGENEKLKDCKVCGIWYQRHSSLVKHALTHAQEPQSVCGMCGKTFQSEDELMEHLWTYQQTYDCSICGKSLLTADGLRSHTTLHTGKGPFKCEVCNKTFTHRSGLRVHRLNHMEDRPYKCDSCPKAFVIKSQLKSHSNIHQVRRDTICHICGKHFFDLGSLTRHRAVHSAERRHVCEVCGDRFKLLQTLKKHKKIHTVKDRPFHCHICSKTLMSKPGLKLHLKTHSGERPFVCVICDKGFVSKGERKKHMRVHTEEELSPLDPDFAEQAP